MGKIITLNQVSRFVKPNTATLMGGSFDLFHVGHLRYLEKAAKKGRPLVVIVQSDKTLRIRKGFDRPFISQGDRAEVLTGLSCVDYVLILDRPSHYLNYIKKIKPRLLIFFKENLRYRKRRVLEIKKKFPEIKTIFIGREELGKASTSSTAIVKKIRSPLIIPKTHDKIVDTLYDLARRSPSKIGQISALLTYRGKIVEKQRNNGSEEHAECLAINHREKKHSLKGHVLFVLIPPCIECAERIVQKGIKEVHFVHYYGVGDGLSYLRRNGVAISHYSPKRSA